MNARAWPIRITSLLLAANLAGCVLWPWNHRDPDPVSVITTPAEKTPLNMTVPEPLRLKPVQWIVVTPQNAEQIFRQLESQGLEPVLFALSDNGYMSLAESMAEVRNFMNTQRRIIIEYKRYYESTAEPKKDQP